MTFIYISLFIISNYIFYIIGLYTKKPIEEEFRIHQNFKDWY